MKEGERYMNSVKNKKSTRLRVLRKVTYEMQKPLCRKFIESFKPPLLKVGVRKRFPVYRHSRMWRSPFHLRSKTPFYSLKVKTYYCYVHRSFNLILLENIKLNKYLFMEIVIKKSISLVLKKCV